MLLSVLLAVIILCRRGINQFGYYNFYRDGQRTPVTGEIRRA